MAGAASPGEPWPSLKWRWTGFWARGERSCYRTIALASGARNMGRGGEDECFRCPWCGNGLKSRGEEVRRLSTSQDQPIELRRSRGVCPACGTGIFPLDEELSRSVRPRQLWQRDFPPGGGVGAAAGFPDAQPG